MKTVEQMAREAKLQLQGVLHKSNHVDLIVFTQAELRAFAALVMEECAKMCDVTPPQPFRPSIEAAHAIRAAAKELK